MRKKKFKKPIASHSLGVESLPFPYVLYPGHYGAFFAFRELPEAPIYLCSCTQRAIRNYIILRSVENRIGYYADPRREFILSSRHFPVQLTEEMMKRTDLKSVALLDGIRFKQDLCHECNNITPNYRYCHEMYGGSFKQTYGWYINKQQYEFGIFLTPVNPSLLQVMLDECPNAIFTHIEKDEYRNLNEEHNVADYEITQQQNNEIHKIIENSVREKIGFKKVGEAWVNETILFNTVKSMFPGYHVVHHYRPDFLKGLEIDVYIEELETGFEYQGIQHYQPIKHFGGEKSHNDLKTRDMLKKKLCKDNCIKLIYIKYIEDVSESLIKSKMLECGITV